MIGDFVSFFLNKPYSSEPLSEYRAPQYGHLASPVSSMGRNTLGWEFHKYISGIGHDKGKSFCRTR